MDPQNDGQTDVESLQRRRLGPARLCRSGPREMAATLGNWLGVRSLFRLFRIHIAVLPGLAAAAFGRGSPRGLRGFAGGFARLSTRSLVLLRGGLI